MATPTLEKSQVRNRLADRLRDLVPNIVSTNLELQSVRSVYTADQLQNAATPLISKHTFSPESIANHINRSNHTDKSINVVKSHPLSNTPLLNKAYSQVSQPMSPTATPSLTQGLLQSLDDIIGRPASRDVNSSQRSFLLQGSDRQKQPRPERYARLLTKFIHENWYWIRIGLIAVGVIIAVLIFPPLLAGIF